MFGVRCAGWSHCQTGPERVPASVYLPVYVSLFAVLKNVTAPSDATSVPDRRTFSPSILRRVWAGVKPLASNGCSFARSCKGLDFARFSYHYNVSSLSKAGSFQGGSGCRLCAFARGQVYSVWELSSLPYDLFGGYLQVSMRRRENWDA